jgi:hypothetical protein
MMHSKLPLATAVCLVGLAPGYAQTPPKTPEVPTPKIISENLEYRDAARRLLEAVQKLRNATHAMAKERGGSGRNNVVKQTSEALFETQLAMVQLPLALRQAPSSAPNYTEAMDKLKQAARKLREATQAMVAPPPGESRLATRQQNEALWNAAVQQTNEALWKTQQVMIALVAQGTDPVTTGSNTSR